MSPRPVPAVVVATVCALLLGTAVYLALRSLALYGDGAYYLVRVIGTGRVFGLHSRVFVNAIQQAPLLLGLRLGATDLRSLTVLYGLGQLVVPALVWSGALVLARSSRFVFAMAALVAGVCVSTTWLFGAHEATLAVPLASLLAVLLWRPNPWSAGHAVLAATAALVLVRSHESLVLTSIVLCLWAVWRFFRSAGLADRFGCAAVAALSAAFVIGVLTRSADLAESPNAVSLRHSVLALEPLPLYVAAAASALLLAAVLLPAGRRRVVLLGLALLAGSAAAIALATPPIDVYGAYAARGGNALIALTFTVALFLLWWNGSEWVEERGAESTFVVTAAVILACAFVATLVPRAERWSQSLSAFREQVVAASGLVSVDRVLPPDKRGVVWGWTSPSLSLVVRDSPEAGILVDSKPTYVPFLPEEARKQMDDRYTWRADFP